MSEVARLVQKHNVVDTSDTMVNVISNSYRAMLYVLTHCRMNWDMS